LFSISDTKGGGYSNGLDDDKGKMCFNAAKVSQKKLLDLPALKFH